MNSWLLDQPPVCNLFIGFFSEILHNHRKSRNKKVTEADFPEKFLFAQNCH